MMLFVADRLLIIKSIVAYPRATPCTIIRTLSVDYNGIVGMKSGEISS